MTTVIVDDTDVSQLKYTGRWFRGGVASEYNSTTHGTQTKGSAVVFQFRGTSIAVYGTISAPPAKNNTAISTYKVDNSSPVTFTAPVVASPVYHQLLYRSPILQDGLHTLTVTAIADGTPRLWIDYITYTTTSDTGGATTLVSSKPIPSVTASRALPVSSSSSSSSGSSAASSASITSQRSQASSAISSVSSITSSSATASPASDAAAASPSPSNLPVILAAILVPLFLILFALLGLFWWRKRRNEKWQGNHVLLDEDPSSHRSVPPEAKNISPFFAAPPVYTPSAPPSAAGFETSYTPSSRAPSTFTVSNPDPFAGGGEGASVVTSRAGGYLPHEPTKGSPLAAPNATYQQHTDGGVRLDADGKPIVDVPPAYGRY